MKNLLTSFFVAILTMVIIVPLRSQSMQGQWVAAGYLNNQTSVMDASNHAVKIVSVKVISREREVYNLEVEDWHSYYANRVLVHNAEYNAVRAGDNATQASMGDKDGYVTEANGNFVTGQCNPWDILDPICQNSTIQQSWGSPVQFSFEGGNPSGSCMNILQHLNDDHARIWSDSWYGAIQTKNDEAFTIPGINFKLTGDLKGGPKFEGNTSLNIPERQAQLGTINSIKRSREFASQKMFNNQLQKAGCPTAKFKGSSPIR